MKSQHTSQAYGTEGKRNYETPMLRELGNLASVTLSGQGSRRETDFQPGPGRLCEFNRRERPC